MAPAVSRPVKTSEGVKYVSQPQIDARRDEMLRLRFDGLLSVPEIARRFGLTYSRAQQILGNTRGLYRQKVVDRVISIMNDDPAATVQDVVDRSGILKATVKRIVRQNGKKQVIPFELHFWQSVKRGSPDDCWPWLGAAHKFRGPTNPYGKITVGPKKTEFAHRVAYRLSKGPIPTGMVVCHKCDNPACCNPDHLVLGTMADNIHDAMAKGRRRARNKVSSPLE